MHASIIVILVIFPCILFVTLIVLLILYRLMRREQKDIVDLVELSAKVDKEAENTAKKEAETEPFPLFNPNHTNIGEDEIHQMPVKLENYSSRRYDSISPQLTQRVKIEPQTPTKNDEDLIAKMPRFKKKDEDTPAQELRTAASNIYKLRTGALTNDVIAATSDESTTPRGRARVMTTIGEESTTLYVSHQDLKAVQVYVQLFLFFQELKIHVTCLTKVPEGIRKEVEDSQQSDGLNICDDERRQKCDRQIPCSRCVKRGDAASCTRDWPEQYDPKKHRVYPRPEGADSPAKSSPAASIIQVAQGNGQSSYQSPFFAKPPQQEAPVSQGLPTYARSVSDYQGGSYNAVSVPQGSAERAPADIENAASVLEFLAWGRSKLSDYDVKALELLKEPHYTNRDNAGAPDWDLSHGFGETGAAQMSFLQLLLPNRKQIFQLVEYHSRSILWYHSSYHGPAFQRELEDVHQAAGGLQIRDMDLRWAALLFSIMAGSMTCASDQMAMSWGFRRAERSKLTKQWYKASVTCLNLAEFMSRHHIYSVEAIATLTMSAHILGFSNDQAVLLGAALKIAQSLGLQRLGPELDDDHGGEQQLGSRGTEKIISREVGRRLWAQLCIQDWFSIPFSEMYSIKPLHVQTTKPLNYDDETMTPLAPEFPTDVSYGNYLFEIASLMPQVHDAIAGSNTLYTKYEQVLEYDAKMRALATEGMPKYFSIREGIEASWPAFIPWARRSLTICFAHKIIMIHRAFLGRSFTNSAFAFTRRTCIAAAKTILKEAKQAYDDEGPLLWIDQAFMIAAGITLSLDMFHRKATDPEFDEHQKLAETTIMMLGKFDNSMIATRGIRLLSSLLSEQARLSTQQALNSRKRDAPEEEESYDGNGKRQKFNVPKFVETFYGGPSFTQALKTVTENEFVVKNVETDNVTATNEKENAQSTDLVYETFAELFPPQTGISNAFLFEDLLNFDVF